MYSMGTFCGFQKPQNLQFKLRRGKIFLLCEGDKVQKIKHVQFGVWFAFLLSVFLPLFPHTTLSSGVREQPVHAVVRGQGGFLLRATIVSHFSFPEYIESWSIINKTALFLTNSRVIVVRWWIATFQHSSPCSYGVGSKKALLLVLPLLKSACGAGPDFMHDACWMKNFFES